MNIISVRENKGLVDEATVYFQKIWASENTMALYEDCISHSTSNKSSVPNWYLLKEGDQIIGCAGLITNDFISRMDLWPWLCALYIEPDYRGQGLGFKLVKKIIEDTRAGGFEKLYLCTDHVGYYEKGGFKFIGQGYHPWGDTSRIYEIETANE